MEEKKNIIVTTKLSTKVKVIIASAIGAIITISIIVFKKLTKDND